MVRVIAELGSCHMGKLSYIKEAIDRCKDNGIDALKLQLFPNEAPYVPTNIHLPQTLFLNAFDYGKKVGVPVSASVFDYASFLFLKECAPQFIKFSFSKKDQTSWIKAAIRDKVEAIVSCDVMMDRTLPVGSMKLYCIPEYPVRYEVDFSEIFPRFNGFSDHTLGMRQTFRAVEAGAKIIEKHVTLPHQDINCPDSFFAVSIGELGQLKI
jgi:sialic acid synthase SpsE